MKNKNDYQWQVAELFKAVYVNSYATEDEDKMFISVDGTPATCHLFLLDDEVGQHIVFTNNTMNELMWEDYLIKPKKVFLNGYEQEVSFEELTDKLMDVYSENFI